MRILFYGDSITDAVHPAEPGAKLIANEWLRFFKEEIE